MQELLSRLLGRRMAYRRTFNPENRDVQVIMADLRDFCCAQKSTVRVSPISRTVDPIAMAVAEGRREVWMRIQQYLNMSDNDIARMQVHQPGE